LADSILNAREPSERVAAIKGLDALEWKGNERALAALVIASQEGNASIRALTSEEMGRRRNFDHVWDFDTVWEFEEGGAHPALRRAPVAKEQLADGGSGTAEDPHLIATARQLDEIRNNLGSDRHFRQVCDIDLAGYGDPEEGWNPIGRGEGVGSYDGGGYKIRNLYVNRPGMDNVGLFGSLVWGDRDAPGKLSRIALENVNIVGRDRTGALAGALGCAGSKTSAKTVVENCYATGKLSGRSIVGGLAGQVFSCKAVNCFAAVTVKASDGGTSPFVDRLWWGGAARNCFYDADRAGVENPETAALRTLRRHCPELDGTAFLYQLLRSDDPFLRSKSAQLAAALHPDLQVMTTGMVEALKDDRYDTRRLARRVADGYGDDAKKEIVSALAAAYDPRGETLGERACLARAAGELATEASVAFLLNVLGDPSADVRFGTMQALRWMGIGNRSRDNIIGPQSVWWKNRPELAARAAAELRALAEQDPDQSCRAAARAAIVRVTREEGEEPRGHYVRNENELPPNLPEAERELLRDTYAKAEDIRYAMLKDLQGKVPWPYGTASHLVHAAAHLHLKQNLEAANRVIMENTDVFTTEAGGLVAPLWATVYGLFNRLSPYPHLAGRLSEETEALFKERMLTYLKYKHDRGNFDCLDSVWALCGTENHHYTFGPPLWYLYLGYLKDDPEYADLALYEGMTVSEWYERLRDYMLEFLRARALGGLWVEMGAGYAKYSVPAVYALVVGARDPVVRQRAQMLLDLILVEEAQISYGYVRGGGKSRAHIGVGGTMSHMLPILYGDRAVFKGYHYGTFHTVLCPYLPSPEAVLIQKRHQYPERPMLIANRRPGEWDETPGLPRRLNLRYLARDYTMINTCYRTRHFMLGSTLRPPNASLSGIAAQNMWGGLIFASGDGVYPAPVAHGRYSDPYYSFQHKDVMVVQKNRGAYRTGIMRVYVKPKTERVERDGWVFVNDAKAYCAIRVLDGGYKWSGDGNYLIPEQDLSPILLQGGNEDAYQSLDGFVSAVLANTVSWSGEEVAYSGLNQPEIEFSTRASGRSPRVNGQEFSFKPSRTYDSPFMTSDWGSSTVTVTVGSLETVYDFDKNKVVRSVRQEAE